MATGDGSPGVTRHSTEPHDATERRRTEEAALESDTTLRAFLDSASEAVVIVDGDGRIVLFSARAEEMFGYSRDELLGQTVETLIPGRFRDAHVRHRADYVSHPRVRPIGPGLDLVGRRKDGTEFPVEIGLSFIEKDRGPLIMSLIVDISERKRAEAALQASEERLRILFEYAPDAYFLSDPQGNLVDLNRAAEEITGLSREESIGKNYTDLDLLPPEDLLRATAILAKSIAGEPAGPTELTFNRRNGGSIAVEVRTLPVEIRSQALILAMARDISMRKRVEEALRESDEKYRTLVESAFEGIVISRAGKILEANESFARMFGYELPEVIGLSPVELTTLESAELIFNNVQSGIEKPYEITGIKKDGATISIEVIGKNRVYQGREARITAFRYITEIKRAEEARQQARGELEGRVERQLLRRNPYGLTFRELTVLHLVATGKSGKEIGIDLGISPLTARKHISNILTKMDATSRTEAVARCLREGLLD